VKSQLCENGKNMTDQKFGLLCGEEIKASGLVRASEDKFYRAATYDLSVGDIILDGGKTCEGSTYALKPGGMVRVVSKESLALPDTITGHVLLKNELCTRGVLAINIGVVDPGFEGPISSTLINFGRADFVVEKGTPFLRVSFHHCPQSPRANNAQKYDRETYLKRVKQEVLAYSGPTFLNMDATATEAAKKAFDSFKNALFGWATGLALLIALLAIFAPLGAAIVDKYVTNNEQHEAQMEQVIEKKVEDRYADRLKELSDKVDRLSQAPQQTSKTNTSISGNTSTR
jgi:deoxycytidine triphosphate deaminase